MTFCWSFGFARMQAWLRGALLLYPPPRPSPCLLSARLACHLPFSHSCLTVALLACFSSSSPPPSSLLGRPFLHYGVVCPSGWDVVWLCALFITTTIVNLRLYAGCSFTYYSPWNRQALLFEGHCHSIYFCCWNDSEMRQEDRR